MFKLEQLFILMIDPCMPNPCQNGAQCVPQGTTFMCQCGPGYSGQRYLILINFNLDLFKYIFNIKCFYKMRD